MAAAKMDMIEKICLASSRELMESTDQEILSFYAFVTIDKPEEHAEWQRETARGLLGRIIVAREGINGTLSGPSAKTQLYESNVQSHLGLCMDFKRSRTRGDYPTFPDLKVTVNKELVSNGELMNKRLSDFYTSNNEMPKSGEHLSPAEFRERMLSDAIVLDVRNSFEYEVGHFKNAIKAPIRTMSEWAQWFETSGIIQKAQNKQVLMYCTGGIRCEKASRYLHSLGIERVAQLDGGIARYLETPLPIDNIEDGTFLGRNFVFDAREIYPEQPRHIVGLCSDCSIQPCYRHSGRNVCSVCETLTLLCDECATSNHEHYCQLHFHLRDAYCAFLDRYSVQELAKQQANLESILDSHHTAKNSANVRRALRKQLQRVQNRRDTLLITGSEQIYTGPPRCRSCGLVECLGTCWGFWRAAAAAVPPSENKLSHSSDDTRQQKDN